jgi:hypothetical protein
MMNIDHPALLDDLEKADTQALDAADFALSGCNRTAR